MRPGIVTPDTKTYLYLDPLRFLSQAAFMWDPTVGLGTVTHEYIGYLLPMGPFFALFHLLGVPVWVAQRLWLGSILMGAGLGVLYLSRIMGLRGPGPTAAALAYMLSPYFLQYAGRISVILLPWAGLPFMLGLTIVAVRRGGWREPALFAVVVALVSGINASSIIYVGVAPILWILYAVVVLRESTWRHALATALRIGVLTLGACLWWIAGLEVEAAYGVNVLKYTETVPSTSATSNAADIIRGLGYWYFYGTDHLGPWTTAAVRYTQDIWLLATSYAVPVLALVAAAFVRWRERAFFLLLLFVGLILSVGPFPFSNPTAVGGVLKAFMTDTTAGLALRSTDRATPLVLLALFMLLGSGLSALWSRFHIAGLVTAVLVAGLVVANNPSLFLGDTIANNFTQPAALPSYQLAAIKHLNATHPGTRVFAIPGNDFAAYRWGDTVDTPQPALLDRGFVTREQQILGSIATADTLYATDGPLQDGTANLNALAPMSRLMGAGDLMVQYDQQYERYGVPQPQLLSLQLLQTPLGLTDPMSFGVPRPNTSVVSTLNEQDLSVPGNPGWPSPIVTYTVPNPRAMVRGESDTGALVMEGDATGLNNLAGLGLLNTDSAVYYAGTLADQPTRLQGLASQGAQLVLTDTNRKEAFRWDTLTANSGYTETPDENPAKSDLSDSPIELFPGTTITSKSYATYVGAVNVTASSYGNSVSYTPEDQAYSAIDNNFDTAWITGTFVPDPKGEWWQSQFTNPVTTDHITLVQPQRGDRSRWVSKVTLTFDGKDPVTYDLNASSHVIAGQTLTFPTPDLPHAADHHRLDDEQHGAAAGGVRRRVLRGRDPGPVGAPGDPDAHPDAEQRRDGVGRRPPHGGHDPPAHLAVPAAQRPGDDDLAPVHPADGPDLHAVGEREPVGLDPRRRGRPPGGPGHHAGQHGAGRLLVGPVARGRAGHRVGHGRRRPGDGLAARARQQGAGGLHADLRPGQAPDVDRAGHAGGRRRAPLGTDLHDHHLGDPDAQHHAATDRRRHGAQRGDDRAGLVPGAHRLALRRHLHRRPPRVRGELLLGGPARTAPGHRRDRPPRRQGEPDAGHPARDVRVQPAHH